MGSSRLSSRRGKMPIGYSVDQKAWPENHEILPLYCSEQKGTNFILVNSFLYCLIDMGSTILTAQ